MPDSKTRAWFRPWGWIFRPIHPAGLLGTVLPAAFIVQTFLVVDARSHSATDTLYAVFPYASTSFLLWLWLADRTSATARRAEVP